MLQISLQRWRLLTEQSCYSETLGSWASVLKLLNQRRPPVMKRLNTVTIHPRSASQRLLH